MPAVNLVSADPLVQQLIPPTLLFVLVASDRRHNRAYEGCGETVKEVTNTPR